MVGGTLIKAFTMLYFKKVVLDNTDSNTVECALRRYAIKRYTPLDLNRSLYGIGSDMLFMGRETQERICFTRLRTELMLFFPKLIIAFEKKEGFNSYSIRYNLWSMLFIGFAMLIIISGLFRSMEGKLDENAVFFTCVLFVFWGVTQLEIKLLKRQIDKAINLYKSETTMVQ